MTGELSIKCAYLYMLFLLTLGLTLAWYLGRIFFYLSVVGLFLGVLYSHPWTRLKDKPWISAIFVIGFAIEGIGVWSIYDSITIEAILFNLHVFVLICSLVYLKDWKDIEGDRSSLPLAYGKNRAIYINTVLMLVPLVSFSYLILRYSWIALLSFFVYALFALQCGRILHTDPVAFGNKLKHKMVLAMVAPNFIFGAIFFLA